MPSDLFVKLIDLSLSSGTPATIIRLKSILNRWQGLLFSWRNGAKFSPCEKIWQPFLPKKLFRNNNCCRTQTANNRYTHFQDGTSVTSIRYRGDRRPPPRSLGLNHWLHICRFAQKLDQKPEHKILRLYNSRLIFSSKQQTSRGRLVPVACR